MNKVKTPQAPPALQLAQRLRKMDAPDAKLAAAELERLYEYGIDLLAHNVQLESKLAAKIVRAKGKTKEEK